MMFALAILLVGAGPSTYTATNLDQLLSATALSLNDSGEIVGSGSIRKSVNHIASPDWFSFYFHDGQFSDLASSLGVGSTVNAINNRDQAVGHRGPQPADAGKNILQTGFFYDGSTVLNVGNLGGPMTNAIGLNNSGAVVGMSYFDIVDWHAFFMKRAL